MPLDTSLTPPPLPHDDWALHYDFVFQKTLGSFYKELTQETVATIKSFLPAGRIIDFGAGTGRLVIPLAQAGYEVVAVEESQGMAGVIRSKAKRQHVQVDLHECTIAAFKGKPADLGIAVVSVLSYSLTDAELAQNLDSICSHLRPGGRFLFDLPLRDIFTAGKLMSIHRPGFDREVDMVPTDTPDVYTYQEICSGLRNGREFHYEVAIPIRHWPLEQLDALLQARGFQDTKVALPHSDISGATYRLYERR